ncbi:CDP-diacylglycerol--serine O-phosphatidyltransferase [Palleronia aestuarii]|uniref:CDP-diacylglycerol--serine O-phosphatidyltransferase n=1 Tax=Palleronia aestuarii TaxID=568105 RepID=A0A2W7NHN2_9RHOB|nr:CDP-diacylglycerol--serine O-phosphatidyltransferase [Palleronia aestuarii]PZX19935.1 CDP-diacylglycerol--serine O-phosphatidyltransferase [Palleronia aestuarii]
MTSPPPRASSELGLLQLLPNLLTLGAICAGLTAIRLAVQGDYLLAVQLIILAALLDGVDGRLARLLRSDSQMGAELDSLADFLNFGVTPPLVLYFWALEDTRSLGWIAALVFAICCVIRLARFNIAAKSEVPVDPAFFMGVPSPAAAILVMLPMYLSFAFADRDILPDLVLALYMMAIGVLMIVRVPTYSFKKVRISRENAKFALLGAVVVGAFLLIYSWIALVGLCLAYIATVAWAWTVEPVRRRKGK